MSTQALRGRGLARAMLERAEATCRDAGTPVLTLSTSELQQAALAFYRKSGYRLVREETAAAQTNKTVGGDIRRYLFREDALARAVIAETGAAFETVPAIASGERCGAPRRCGRRGTWPSMRRELGDAPG